MLWISGGISAVNGCCSVNTEPTLPLTSTQTSKIWGRWWLEMTGDVLAIDPSQCGASTQLNQRSLLPIAAVQLVKLKPITINHLTGSAWPFESTRSVLHVILGLIWPLFNVCRHTFPLFRYSHSRLFLDQGLPDFGNLVDSFFFYMLSLFVSWTYKVRMDLFSSVGANESAPLGQPLY